MWALLNFKITLRFIKAYAQSKRNELVTTAKRNDAETAKEKRSPPTHIPWQNSSGFTVNYVLNGILVKTVAFSSLASGLGSL